MAKTKQLKRKEALARQYESFQLRLKDWCKYMALSEHYKDNETTSVYDSNLVKSAHAAHRDCHGNYLDERYYKNCHYFGKDADPEYLALNHSLFSIDELKTINDHSGMTLYKIAYGNLSDKRQARKEPYYDTNDVMSMLNFMNAGDPRK